MITVVEGLDGSGKSRVARAIAEALGALFYEFPRDDGVTGPLIRSYLRREWRLQGSHANSSDKSNLNSALAFQALQVTNRMEVAPELRRYAAFGDRTNEHAVLARYWQSGWVYGSLDGLDPKFLVDIHRDMPQARANIYLDVAPELAMERQSTRDAGKDPERYEGKLDFTRKVAAKYRELWEQHSDDPAWTVVDASKPIEVVVAASLRYVLSLKP